MPRKRTGKKLTTKKSSSKKSKANLPKEIDKESFNSMRKWAEDVKNANLDYQFDAEIVEINSDEESDEFECNLKDLEVRLKSIIDDSFWLIKSFFISSETAEVFAVSISTIKATQKLCFHVISMFKQELSLKSSTLCRVYSGRIVRSMHHIEV